MPDHETLTEIPEDVLTMYARRYIEQGGPALSRMIDSGPEFGELFRTFKHTAFRLETRDHY